MTLEDIPQVLRDLSKVARTMAKKTGQLMTDIQQGVVDELASDEFSKACHELNQQHDMVNNYLAVATAYMKFESIPAMTKDAENDYSQADRR